MSDAATKLDTQDIVVDEVFPHAPETIWKTLTTADVTWFLSRVENGTRLRLVHSGFMLPKNNTAFKNMSDGWTKVLQRIDTITGEHDSSKAKNPSSNR